MRRSRIFIDFDSRRSWDFLALGDLYDSRFIDFFFFAI